MIQAFFRVYSPRWGHDDEYHVTLTKESFVVSHDMKKAKCEVDENNQAAWTGYNQDLGNPLLRIFSNDAVYVPYVVPEAIEWLLGEYRNGEIPDADAEDALEELFRWIDQTARTKPTHPIWKSYF